MCFELESHMVVYPIAGIHKSRNQEVEMEMVSLTVTPSDPQGKIFTSYPCDFMLCGLEMLVPEKGPLVPEDAGKLLT